MSLKKILEDEILQEKTVELSKSDLIELVNQHHLALSWCSRRDDMREVCRRYLETVRSSIRALASLRMTKMLQSDNPPASDEILNIVVLIRDLYLRYLYDLPIDPMERIPVRIKADIRLGDKVLLRGRGYLLPLVFGLKLIIAGLAEPILLPLA
ncbi:MAG: hypothetical protein QXJ51_05775 [Sulfolobales archaeon]